MKGLIYSEPAYPWRLVRDWKGTSLVLTQKPFETNLANVGNNERPTKLLKDPRQDNYLKDFDDEITVPEKIKRIRESLPIFDKKEVILDAIRGSQVVLIKGETGCGKTTQVPQYILEDRINDGNGSMTNILVTQPRRISAVSMANRVAEERGEKMGQNNGPQVRWFNRCLMIYHKTRT